MTIKECIDIVDSIKPNQYTVEDKVMWLSFIDAIIINDVLKTHEGYDGRYDLFEGYSADKLSVRLIVPSPYDRLYTAYLQMKIDQANGETARYNNSVTLYNAYMTEYRKHYNKTHMPLDMTVRNRAMAHQKKVASGLSEAEYENLKRDLSHSLSEHFADSVSPDKLYDIVTSYAQNNAEMLNGKDGISASHRWDGTKLIMESASGVTSADLKGDTGEKGKDGGYYKPIVTPNIGFSRWSINFERSDNSLPYIKSTVFDLPLRGRDYWTSEDIGEIRAYINNSINASNSTVINGTTLGKKCAEFAGLFNGTDKVESFLFFTDPHLLNNNNGSETQMLEYLHTVRDCYDRTPTNFVVCGGDWIGNSDTEEEACYKLSYSNSYCKSLFGDYYPVVGNHDINFEGGTGRNTATLSNETLRNVWQQKDKLYYAFDGANTRFYVLDTQTVDSEDTNNKAKNRYFTDYRSEQMEWLRDMLVAEDKENSAIICHIMIDYESESVKYYINFADKIMQFLELYNNRSSGTFAIANENSGKTYEIDYDFSQCTGAIRFVLCGHTHHDAVLTKYSIPTICTTQLRDGDTPTFDLCLADYDNNVLHCVRVGTGENRTITLPYVEKDTSVYLIHVNLSDNLSQANTKRITIVSSRPTPETGALLHQVDGTYPYYGFAVPEGATKITVTCPGYQWYLKDVVPSNYASSEGYALVNNNSTWVESGTAVEFYGQKKYFCIALRNNPEANFPADFDHSGISWTFE
jgi:hypothetical protein